MTTSPSNPGRLAIRLAASALLVLALTSCESDRPSRRSGPAAAVAGAATPAPAPMPPMEAHGSFFAGQIDVDVSLNGGGSPWARGSNGRVGGQAGAARERGGGRMSAGMGAGMGGGRGGRGGMGGGGMPGDGGAGMGGSRGSGIDDAMPSNAPRPVMRESNQPPVQFHLRLTNHGTESVMVEVLDFNSPLGNFVVQPRKLEVPAGGAVEAEPMTSRLGLPDNEVPLTVRLRAPAGTEQQTLALKPVAPTPGGQPPTDPGAGSPP